MSPISNGKNKKKAQDFKNETNRGRNEQGLTFNCWGKQDQCIVEIASISLQGDLGVIGELEIEVETSRLEGLEEQRMGRFDGEVIE